MVPPSRLTVGRAFSVFTVLPLAPLGPVNYVSHYRFSIPHLSLFRQSFGAVSHLARWISGASYIALLYPTFWRLWLKFRLNFFFLFSSSLVFFFFLPQLGDPVFLGSLCRLILCALSSAFFASSHSRDCPFGLRVRRWVLRLYPHSHPTFLQPPFDVWLIFLFGRCDLTRPTLTLSPLGPAFSPSLL